MSKMMTIMIIMKMITMMTRKNLIKLLNMMRIKNIVKMLRMTNLVRMMELVRVKLTMIMMIYYIRIRRGNNFAYKFASIIVSQNLPKLYGFGLKCQQQQKQFKNNLCDIKLFGVNWKDDTGEEDENFKNDERGKVGSNWWEMINGTKMKLVKIMKLVNLMRMVKLAKIFVLMKLVKLMKIISLSCVSVNKQLLDHPVC